MLSTTRSASKAMATLDRKANTKDCIATTLDIDISTKESQAHRFDREVNIRTAG
jgi:hypothetical protein